MSSNWPNFQGFIASQWPGGIEGFYQACSSGAASNIVVGTNPPWGAADFFAQYPQFGGATKQITGSINGAVVTGIEDTGGLQPGMPVGGPGLSGDTVIYSVDSQMQLTLSRSALNAPATPVTLTVWDPKLMLVPLPVLNAYIALASASLMQARWRDAWILAMGWFVAHYVTLWLKSAGDACSNLGKLAASGLSQGLTINKSVGPVSMGIKPLDGMESWGTFALTIYGQQLASMARFIGMGPMLIY